MNAEKLLPFSLIFLDFRFVPVKVYQNYKYHHKYVFDLENPKLYKSQIKSYGLIG